MKRYLKFVLVVSASLVIALFLISTPAPTREAYVIVNNARIAVDVADTYESRTRGLMFRDKLLDGYGMLFVFETQGNYPFWMMNMKFAIDILWINSKGEVVYIAKNAQPCSLSCPSIDPKVDAKYVLEVNAGFVDRNGVDRGSFIHIFIPEP